MDSATPIDGAIKHYKSVPQNQKQIFIAKGGGHCPALTELDKNVDEFIDLVESSLNGKKISDEELKNVVASSSAKASIDWVYTSKNW